MSREHNISTMNATVDSLRQENEFLRQQSRLLEPAVSLPAKFDGSRSSCRDFINQVRLIFRLQPQRYPDDYTKTCFIGTLLSGSAAAWFSPLFEQDSPLLLSLDQFISHFHQTFGDFDRETTAANEIRNLRQGNRSASEYSADFRRLASDLNWGEAALVDQFRRGLRDDVKDLLLTLPLPTSLHEAISFSVRCDNRIMERRLERRSGMPPRFSKPVSPNVVSEVTPMEIDAIKPAARGPLALSERERRRRLNLCMYCGQPGHFLKDCSLRTSAQGNSKVRQQ
jgi:hypothetical protein